MKLVVIAAISLLAITSAAEDTKADKPTALVRAMAADEIVLEASKWALSSATKDGHLTAAQNECFRKLPASAFTADLAGFLSRQLTPGEMVEALAFYESQPGIKLVDLLIETLEKESGESFTAIRVDSGPMTVEEMKAVRAFMETNAGTKLAQNKVVMMSPESREIARKIIARQLNKCGARVPQ